MSSSMVGSIGYFLFNFYAAVLSGFRIHSSFSTFSENNRFEPQRFNLYLQHKNFIHIFLCCLDERKIFIIHLIT